MDVRDLLFRHRPGWLRVYDAAEAQLPSGVRISSARQKRGCLDIDVTAYTPATNALVDWVWDESSTVCEICGNAGGCLRRWHFRGVTLCDICDDSDERKTL